MKLFDGLDKIANNTVDLNPYSSALGGIQEKYDELGQLDITGDNSPEWVDKWQEWEDELTAANDSLAQDAISVVGDVQKKLDFVKNGSIQLLQAHHDIMNEVRKIDGDMNLIAQGCSENLLGAIASITGDTVGTFGDTIDGIFDAMDLETGLLTLAQLQSNIDKLRTTISAVHSQIEGVIEMLGVDYWQGKANEAIEFIKAYAVYKLVQGNPCARSLAEVMLPDVKIDYPPTRPSINIPGL